MAKITVQVAYADGTPAGNQTVHMVYNYPWYDVGYQPEDHTGTTNTQGNVELDGNWPGNAAVSGTITSEGGDSTNFTVQTDANGNASTYQTVYWNPIKSVTTTLSTAGAKIGNWLFTIIILAIMVIVVILIVKWLKKGGATKIYAVGREAVTSGAGLLSGILG